MNNLNKFVAVPLVAAALATSSLVAKPDASEIKPVVKKEKVSFSKVFDNFDFNVNGKEVFKGSHEDKGNNYGERAEFVKNITYKNKISRERAEILRDGNDFSKDGTMKPVQDTGKINKVFNPNGRSNNYKVTVSIQDTKTGEVVKAPSLEQKVKSILAEPKKLNQKYDYYKFIDAKSGKVIETHPGFRVLEGKNYTSDFKGQILDVEKEIGHRTGGWFKLDGTNKNLYQSARNNDKASFYVQKYGNKTQALKAVKNFNNGKSETILLETIRPEDFVKYMANYKSENNSQIEGLNGTFLVNSQKQKNLVSPKYKPMKSEVMNLEINPEVQEVKTPVFVGDKVKEESGKVLETKFAGTYSIYFDADDKKDLLKVHSIPGRNSEIVKVEYGNGSTKMYSLDKVRSDILKTFEFTDRENTDKIVRKYLMAVDGSGEEAVRFMIETNNNAKRVQLEDKLYNPDTQTRLSDSTAVVSFADKVANAKVRGEYLGNHILKESKDGTISVVDNKFARNVYSGSFSDDVSMGRLILGFTVNSAIYTTITSDWLPRIEEDAALAQSRGANMNTYAVNVQNGGKKNLYKNTMNSFNGFVEMYNGNIEATKINVRKNQF